MRKISSDRSEIKVPTLVTLLRSNQATLRVQSVRQDRRGQLGKRAGADSAESAATWEITLGNRHLKHEIEPIRCI